MPVRRSPKGGGKPVCTTAELAALAGGSLVGRGDVPIRGVAEIDHAGPGDVTYAVSRAYFIRLACSKAGAAVVPLGAAEAGLPMPLIQVKNPQLAFARLLARFAPPVPPPAQRLHPSAVVADSAEVDPSAFVGPCAVIEPGVRVGRRTVVGAGVFLGYGSSVGDDCVLYPNAVVREFCRLGHRVILHAGAVIGTDGFGFAEDGGAYRKIPQIGVVDVGDDAEIGSCACIDRATMGATLIGAGTKIDNLVQVGHNVEIGRGCALTAQVGISGSTKMGDGCRFAGQAATSGHLAMGAGCTVTARGVVTGDLAPRSVVSGFPARDHREDLKTLAALPRLPDLLRRVRELEQRLAALVPGQAD